MKQIQNETYFDVSELANYLGLTETTIRSYIHNGKIKGLKIGKSWYAKEAAVKAFFAPTNESITVEHQTTHTLEKPDYVRTLLEAIISSPETNKITLEALTEIIKNINVIAELINNTNADNNNPVFSNQDNLTVQK